MNSELEKCKQDPKYFFENYCLLNDKKIKLKDYQIEMLNLFDNCDILKLQHHIIDVIYNKIFKNELYDNIRTYREIAKH